jgi:hypothetical protein
MKKGIRLRIKGEGVKRGIKERKKCGIDQKQTVPGMEGKVKLV